jgi:hypothetical protein
MPASPVAYFEQVYQMSKSSARSTTVFGSASVCEWRRQTGGVGPCLCILRECWRLVSQPGGQNRSHLAVPAAFRRLTPTPVGFLGRSFYGRLGPLLKNCSGRLSGLFRSECNEPNPEMREARLSGLRERRTSVAYRP